MSDAIQLSFAFSKNAAREVELCAVRYRSGSLGEGEERLSVRGKTSGAYTNAGTFQWTTAVQGACLVFLKAVLHERGSELSEGYLQGGRGSLVASLDYALTKGPSWLFDMFGVTALGTMRAKRLFRVTNPNRKRPGPVTIAVNTNLLPVDGIEVLLDGIPVTETSTLLFIVRQILAHDVTEPNGAGATMISTYAPLEVLSAA